MEEPGARFSERQVKVLAEVLSRISIRLPAEHRAEMFGLAMEMYRHSLFREHHVMHACVKAVLGRLLSQAMDQGEILSRVELLLTLPIPGQGGFTVRTPERWPEPLEYVSWEDEVRATASLDRSSLATPVASLLSVAQTGPQDARRRAVSRLVKLYEIGGLTDDESTALGEAIWARTDETTDFPADLPYPLHSYLRLPHPPRIDVGQRYKQNALSQEFSPVASNGILSSSLKYDPVARLFRGGPVVLIGRTQEQLRSFVNWSRDEAIEILDKMRRCWDEEKQPLQNWVSRGLNPRSEGSVQGRFLDWVRLISDFILPRVADAPDAVKERVKALLDDLGHIGICTSYAAPSLLYVDATLYNDVVEQVWTGLNSTDETQIDETVRGLCHWVVLGRLDERLPSPPGQLLDELVLRTVARRIPGLETVLPSLSNVLRHSAQALHAEHLEGLCVALRYLLQDTELPDRDSRSGVDTSASPIAVEERPNFRRLSVALAARLKQEFIRRGAQPPEIIESWRTVSLEDPLPEVRRAWHDETFKTG
ncbi:hypothetical protein GBA65_06940 [Rubrobacter marinus]|uniref:Uncharacterized protein n=1 Tax=Rubrobacter marinus TaxID=2653852 RepID=A0A6G8PVQ0_9ACTN|nr:hypothetical protein [Rubrobacter marinus]QIN78291.1 hypothetical protein GBA65_06940 [Rubrobacter marinus]